MDTAFWHERWERGQIGFHQSDINPWLRRYWTALGVAPPARVFVPLCGASLDMAWLAGLGHEVVGIELSATAIARFFAEQGWQPERHEGPIPSWRAGGVALYEGDFFDLRASDLADVAAVYDRAALIALPPPMRPGYAEHLARILPDGTRGLLITLDYDQSEMKGPPFSVPADEVEGLLGGTFEIERLAREPALEANERFRERGLTALDELVFRMRRRSDAAGEALSPDA